MFSGGRQAVSTTAVKVVQADGDGSKVTVKNADASASAFVGGSAVTAANGFELTAGDALAVDLGPSEAIYMITASGTVNVDWVKSE